MKKMYRLCFFLNLFLPCFLLGQDFSIPNSDGIIIYYNNTSSLGRNTVEVTNYQGGGSVVYLNHSTYEGAVNIPAEVTHNDTTYTVTRIGLNAFAYSTMTSVQIPPTVTSLALYAFYFCNALTEIPLHNNLTTIEMFAFAYCMQLQEMTIPYSVTSASEWGIFPGCTSLVNINYLPATPPPETISLGPFEHDCLIRVPLSAYPDYLEETSWDFYDILTTINDYTLTLVVHNDEDNNFILPTFEDIEIGILPEYSFDGHSFNGWFIGDEEVTEETVWAYTEAQIAEAQWIPNTYELTFNSGLENMNIEGFEILYNDTIHELETPARDGYTFEGWYVDTTQIVEGMIWKFTEDKTATAQWRANTYTLLFVPIDGEYQNFTSEVTYDEPIGLLPYPYIPGDQITGWFINGVEIFEETIWQYTDDQTAIAQLASGIDERTPNHIKIYPNPTNGLLHVEGLNITKIEILDLTGKVILTQYNTKIINVATLKNGYYLARITTEKGISTRALIKQ